ncbi:ArpU family phage packaging/lysis transcriptional regulator [Psychrobacillus sp. FSL K6-4046]|uniref:ArpU family phage packaging/lysis transcriptional regulator n=1 Tax=Psychrobacillus sp. FSL K6-4046 TaxID=2921550 RepID=UPI003159C923
MNLQLIDTKKTKKAVERSFGEFRRYLLQLSLHNMPTITSQFSLVPPSGGFNGSKTESSALKNVEYERKREKVLEKTINAVNKLSFKERSIITMKYFGEEEVYDYEVYTELHLSHRQYYRIKAAAFQKLAIAMDIVVWKEEKEHSNDKLNLKNIEAIEWHF